MFLNTLWFILITVLFAGFFFLEGFDYGVGMLLPFLGKNDDERRQILNAIGPVWDGNEVWMITAGGALFASFPQVYATLFSGFYLAMFIILLALIGRGVAFEFRSKREDKGWRSYWDWMIFSGSLIPALLWGIITGNLIRGFAIGSDMNMYGGLLPLLNPFAILGGFVFVGLFIMHGANFLSRKLPSELAIRVNKVTFPSWIAAIILSAGFIIWAFVSTDIFSTLKGIIPGILTVASLGLAGWMISTRKTGWAFIFGSVAIVLFTATVFAGLYPRILISTIAPTYSLTISNAASSHYTLKVMSIVAAIFLPFVLVYQGWSYWIFRKRVGSDQEHLTY